MSIFSFLFLLSFHFLFVPFSLFILPDLYDWLHNHPKYSWCGGTDVLTLTLHTSHHHKPGLEFLRAETGFDGLILTGLSDRCIVTGAGADWGKVSSTLSCLPCLVLAEFYPENKLSTEYSLVTEQRCCPC